MKTLVLAALAILASRAALAAPEPICDDNWTIRPHAMQAQLITLKRATRVQVDLTAVKHADKGFAIHIIPGELWASVVTSNPAISGHFKTGQRREAETGWKLL